MHSANKQSPTPSGHDIHVNACIPYDGERPSAIRLFSFVFFFSFFFGFFPFLSSLVLLHLLLLETRVSRVSSSYSEERVRSLRESAHETIYDRPSRTISRPDTGTTFSSFLVITRIISPNLAQGAAKLRINEDRPTPGTCACSGHPRVHVHRAHHRSHA